MLGNKKNGPFPQIYLEQETVLWVNGVDNPVRCFIDGIIILETVEGDKGYIKAHTLNGTELMYPLIDIIEVDEDTLPQAA